MSTDLRPDLTPEIGHVLLLDVVGYSKLLINEQGELLQTLKELVQGTATVQSATQLLRLATGDGMALVFRDNLEAPAECALQLATALQAHPELPLRMGIHSGPIREVLDVNERANATGAGIDLAQRVMDCGDAGHILVSKRAADDLAPYPRWNALLHDLGEIEVKHGLRVHLFNLYTASTGNPGRPSKLAPASARTVPGARVRWPLLALVALILFSLGGVGWWLISRPTSPAPAPRPTLPATPEKSIAVLPFENLSEEKANAYFADGMQDEILTNLARISDLKVISRTSVMQYRSGTARNLREIGKQLGVAHLLEGSVQRAEGKVRVNAQLIDARTDAHLWAQTYDRSLADIFAIQSDIARGIVEQLQAKLAPEEKTRLDAKPTSDPNAYLLYLQGNELVHVAASREEAVEAEKLYAQAIALDPGFTLARVQASILNSLMYAIGRDPERKERARTMAEEALRRAPELGEAHLALGLCLYRIDHDYPAALKELSIARAASPNDSNILEATGFIYRRQNQWRAALDAFAEARLRDPRRAHFDGEPDTWRTLRQWAKAGEAFQRGLQLEPGLSDGWVGLAYLQFAESGKPALASATLDRLAGEIKKKPSVEGARWEYAMLARDFASAEELVPARPVEEFPAFEPGGYFQACLALAQGDQERARGFLEAIKPIYEAGVRDHPDDPLFHSLLGRIYALLGQKEDAIREGSRAVELCPESKDAVAGPLYETALAKTFAQTGEVDQAVTLLSHLLTTPAAETITLAHLRLGWEWDPLRQDPRFQKLIEGPEPATIYH